MSGPLTPSADDVSFYTPRSPPVRQGSSSWGESSPWGAPPPASTSLGFTLADDDVPSFYRQRWASSEPVQDAISLATLKGMLASGGIKSSSIDKILALTVNSPRITRSTFYTALALLAFAQLHRELTLEAVKSARDNGGLPLPTLPTSDGVGSSAISTSFSPPAYVRSSGSLGEDGWGSGGGSSSSPKANGPSTSNGYSQGFSALLERDNEIQENVFGSGGEAPLALGYDPQTEGWALGRQKKVEVHMRDELEGVVFKHTVWFVAAETGAAVQRRYSDFIWLLDCLTRRYPFRILPSLPPKRVQIAGNYLATDDLFLERRRRGLERFLTFLVNHPTLKRDGLLKTFLEEQSDLSLWRKNTSITLEEESLSHTLTSEDEMSVPSDLEAKLASLRTRIVPLVEHWSRITHTADRLAHRQQNQGGDFEKMQAALQGAVEVETSGWRTVEVEEVEREEKALAQGMARAAETEKESARRALDTTVEDLKRHRELYSNFKDLFARQTALSPDAVDKLKRRVDANLKKLSTIRDAPTTPALSVEFDKISVLITTDQRSIDTLLRRRVFIRWCMWQELLFLFRSASLFKLTVRDLVSQARESARRLGSGWDELGEALGS